MQKRLQTYIKKGNPFTQNPLDSFTLVNDI